MAIIGNAKPSADRREFWSDQSVGIGNRLFNYHGMEGTVMSRGFLNINPTSREYMTLSPTPNLQAKIIDVGSWLFVPLVRVAIEVVDAFQKWQLPNIVETTPDNIDGVDFPKGQPVLQTVHVKHPYRDTIYASSLFCVGSLT